MVYQGIIITTRDNIKSRIQDLRCYLEVRDPDGNTISTLGRYSRALRRMLTVEITEDQERRSNAWRR